MQLHWHLYEYFVLSGILIEVANKQTPQTGSKRTVEGNIHEKHVLLIFDYLFRLLLIYRENRKLRTSKIGGR